MSKTTVNDGASVASPSNIEEALESGILPRDPHYLKTGTFKDEPSGAKSPEKTDAEEQAEYEKELDEQGKENESEENEEHEDDQDSATSGDNDGETAAGSQPAETQDKKPQTRDKGKSESRWAKLSRENRELREQNARLQAGSTTRDTSQASQPAAAAAAPQPKGRPEPKIDDVDAKGQPKYADYDAFSQDLRKWDREQALIEFQDANAKTQREQQQRQAQETISREWSRRCEETAKDLPDFQEVALDTSIPIKAGSIVDVFLLDSDLGPRLLYHLAKHPAELERIQGKPSAYDKNGVVTAFAGGLNPIAQARELSKLEAKLSGSGGGAASGSARPVSQAPRPPHQSSGKGTVTKDAVKEAAEKNDQTTFNRASNERDPRLLAVRRARGKSA